MLTEEFKKEIDEMDYAVMLSNWRFAPVGSLMFQGEIGKYFKKVMQEKEAKLKPGEKAEISKLIGW